MRRCLKVKGKKYVVCHPSAVEEVKKRTRLEVRGSYGVRPGDMILCREDDKKDGHADRPLK